MSDTYAAKVRGSHGQVVLNDGYDGLRLIDCLAGKELATVPFPEGEFPIYNWVIAPDGNKAYLFGSDQTHYAVEADLEGRKSRKIKLAKGFQVATELAWFTPEFRILDYRDSVWELKKDVLVPADEETTNACFTPKFRKVIERFVVAKAHPSGNGLYVRSRKPPQLGIGYLSLADQSELLVDRNGEVIDVTHYKDSLFLALESEIVQYQRGKSSTVLTVTDERSFLRANVVEKDGAGYLTVLSSTNDYSEATSAVGTLSVYKLKPPDKQQ